MDARILLLNPKSPFNVGGALRACHAFGASTLAWTGERVLDREDVRSGNPARLLRQGLHKPKKYRLPREERLKEYDDVRWFRMPASDPQEVARLLRRQHASEGVVPVCVERRSQAEPLPPFRHPPQAVYLFGPEDGSVPASLREACHRFLAIPSATSTPLNLAAAVNVVLYDRYVKG